MAAQRYFLHVEDFSRARGTDPQMSFDGSSAPSFAAALLAALRDPALISHWRAKQADPDAVDASVCALDAQATVRVTPADTGQGGDIEVATSLPHAVLRHRMGLLVGPHWTLRDVKSA